MRDDIDFWTERVVHSAENNDRKAFSEAMEALMTAVNEFVSSAVRQASHEITAPADTSRAASKKKYNLPKAK